MVRVDENRCRCATAADFFQHFAVGHLREAASAIFLRCGHAKHTDAGKAINHVARNVCLPIGLGTTQMFVEESAKFAESYVQFSLLCFWNTRIRDDPVGIEMLLE